MIRRDGNTPRPRPRQRSTARAMIDWEAVGRLVESAPTVDALAEHRLHLVSADRQAVRGDATRFDLALALVASEAAQKTARALLERVRDAYDDRIVVMKGVEVSTLYPAPGLRPFGDVDLLVDDSAAAQRALLDAGFVEVGEPEMFEDIHHLRPLAFPGLMLPIEVHHDVKWPERIATRPATAELLDRAVPSATGVAGVMTLRPADHAVCLAGHSWSHEPLLRLGDVLDFMLVAEKADERELLAVARGWGAEHVVRATMNAGAHLFGGRGATIPLRVWARHLRMVRQRTVLESHLTQWLAPFWELPPTKALAAAGAAIAADVRPESDEGWAERWHRTAVAVRRARAPRAVHDQLLGERAHAGNTVRARIRARTESEIDREA